MRSWLRHVLVWPRLRKHRLSKRWLVRNRPRQSAGRVVRDCRDLRF